MISSPRNYTLNLKSWNCKIWFSI